jgi:phosphoglycerate kinase
LEIAKGKIILPLDVVVADDFMNPQIIKTVKFNEVTAPFMGMDIGPETRAYFAKELQGAKMIFWNGPAGVFERKEFDAGTRALCEAITSVKGAFTVIGGGDSAAAAAEFGFKDKFSHVSTGGGASLEMIENDGVLPGISIISEQ